MNKKNKGAWICKQCNKKSKIMVSGLCFICWLGKTGETLEE